MPLAVILCEVGTTSKVNYLNFRTLTEIGELGSVAGVE
jgi:hypothetical protein